jgi:hypothetical protein
MCGQVQTVKWHLSHYTGKIGNGVLRDGWCASTKEHNKLSAAQSPRQIGYLHKFGHAWLMMLSPYKMFFFFFLGNLWFFRLWGAKLPLTFCFTCNNIMTKVRLAYSIIIHFASRFNTHIFNHHDLFQVL